jgi:hypothetical protein
MKHEADAVPAGPNGPDGAAEKLDVVVPAAEDKLVERLLEGPGHRRNRAGEGSVERSGGDRAVAQGGQL